jgi:hypothetical protein
MRTGHLDMRVTYRVLPEDPMPIAVLEAEMPDRSFQFSWPCTQHFQDRCKERGLTLEDALLVLDLGHQVTKDGYQLYSISRQLARGLGLMDKYRKLMGWVVVESLDGVLVTCFHSCNAHRTIKKKKVLSDWLHHPH